MSDVESNGFEYKEAEAGNTIRFDIKTLRELAMRHQNAHAQLNVFRVEQLPAPLNRGRDSIA